MTDRVARLNAALEGRYSVAAEIGEGGMATVYLAEDLRHHRKVALKVLKPRLAAIVGAERFLAEIETTAKLQHPHILPLYDSGEADGSLFFAMPYVQEESLRERLDREHQLPVDEAVRIAMDVAESLDYAHRHGVIHRDIKPANILLQDGKPVVSDFGIALAVGVAGGGRLTETGVSLGTPHYMSPEQATGDLRLSPATDIYALGCVLYEMLVGEPPYAGSTPQAILGRIITGDAPSAIRERSSVPVHVDAAIRRALEKLPADRFSSAGDFVRALGNEGFIHGRAVGPSSARFRHPGAWTVGGWGLAVALGAFLALSLLAPDPPPSARWIALSTSDRPTEREWMALTPDGSAVVMAHGPVGSQHLEVRRLNEPATVQLGGTERAIDPVVSPDGTRVAFGGQEGLRAIPLEGGQIRTLVGDLAVCCLRWGSDGYVYFSDFGHGTGSIYRVAATGGDRELVLEADRTLGDSYLYFQPLPGDRGIVSVDADPDRIEAVDLASGRRTVLTEGARPYVTANGYLVFARQKGLWAGGLFAAPFDARSARLRSDPVLVVEGVGLYGPAAKFSLSESGDLLFWYEPGADSNQRELVWVDFEGTATSAAPSWLASFESVDLAPGGARAVVTMGPSDLDTEMWLTELDGGPARLLTFAQGLNRRPAWAPDGRSVAFISDRDGPRAAYTLQVDGMGSPELLLALPDRDINEVLWSPDGDWLIYRTGGTSSYRDIYARRLRPDTVTVPVATRPGVDEMNPAISPDGRWLAYASNQTGRFEVWVRPFPDVDAGRRQVSVDGGSEPVWADGGKALLYRSAGRLVRAEVATDGGFATGEVRTLFPDTGYFGIGTHRSFDVDNAKGRILMIRRREADPELILVQNFNEVLKARVPN